MTTRSREDSNLEIALELMQSAVGLMSEFPIDFVPPRVEMPQTDFFTKHVIDGWDIQDMLSNPQIATWLRGTLAPLPLLFLKTFRQSAGILGQILEMLDVTQEGLMLEMWSDPEAMQLLMTVAQIRTDAQSDNSKQESEGNNPSIYEKVMMAEIRRRLIARRAPFARTLTTLLGQDALLWLTTPSTLGVGNIQPHEFTRTGWSNIWSIENQVRIEEELTELPPYIEPVAKIAVALSWTIAALASFVPSEVFLGEQLPYLSSSHGSGDENQYTISYGKPTKTFITFEPSAMRPLVQILASGLANPLLSAADLMWIGAATARVQKIESGHGEAASPTVEKFDVFLSHRGRDAKQTLAEAVQRLRSGHGVFLDCLTLPHGVINRCFIYNSLARSERILIVDTENFNESEWCRKEAWFAEAMVTVGLSKTEHTTLDNAVERIKSDASTSSRQQTREDFVYPIAPRVLRDIDYWARHPNLHSLNEAGISTESLEPLLKLLGDEPEAENSGWVQSVGETVHETLSRVIVDSPEPEPIDLWATALQLAMAALGASSNARSKVEVRTGINQLNDVLKAFVTSQLHLDPTFRDRAPEYLALLAAAAAIELSGFGLDSRVLPAVQIAIRDTAGLRDGLLLLDVRKPGPKRNFRLRMIATLVRGNLGSVGIVQNSDDQVHQNRVDEFPLEILPCVTLYPGMDSPFTQSYG